MQNSPRHTHTHPKGGENTPKQKMPWWHWVDILTEWMNKHVLMASNSDQPSIPYPVTEFYNYTLSHVTLQCLSLWVRCTSSLCLDLTMWLGQWSGSRQDTSNGLEYGCLLGFALLNFMPKLSCGLTPPQKGCYTQPKSANPNQSWTAK